MGLPFLMMCRVLTSPPPGDCPTAHTPRDTKFKPVMGLSFPAEAKESSMLGMYFPWLNMKMQHLSNRQAEAIAGAWRADLTLKILEVEKVIKLCEVNLTI